MGKMFNNELNEQKRWYADTRALNDAFMAKTALACGEKQTDKSQGNYNFIYDPQGIVYDGTLDYPVAGVRAELWTANDGDGTAARYWSEAADYDQINPQTTEADGMFSWFTPEGWWQVRIFDTTTNAPLGQSEWLKVLPPHFGVNINIGGEPLTITYDGNGIELSLLGFPDDPDNDELTPINLPRTVYLVPQGRNHTVIANMFTVEGLDFAGWNTEADGSGAWYWPSESLVNVQADTTLYAQWGTVSSSGNPSHQPSTSSSATIHTPTPPPDEGWDNPYIDVVDTDWFYNAVRFVTEHELMEGTGANRFSPNVVLTRAMIVTILYRLEGKPAVSGDIPFSDVKAGEWYSDAILWASRNSIVLGYGNGLYGPEDPVTREQAVVILHRYAQFKGLDVSAADDLAMFVDRGKISAWALDAMKWAVAVGIIEGRSSNKIAPEGSSTRAEIAMIFKRYIDDFLDNARNEDDEPEE